MTAPLRQSQADYVHSVLALSPVVLDVRTKAEWDAGHLTGARHIPVPLPPLQYDDLCRIAAAIGQVALSLQKDHPVAVYCKKGVRSGLAAALLRAQGMTRVYDLGGVEEGPLSSYLKT